MMEKMRLNGPTKKMNESIFLSILYERVKKDPNSTPSFKATDWQDMDEEMYLATGERYGPMKLQGKYNRPRQKHLICIL